MSQEEDEYGHWSKIDKSIYPEKYLEPEDSPFCTCGHHVEDHGYSVGFEDEQFCFHEFGNKSFQSIVFDSLKGCSCTGFKSYKKKLTLWRNGL